MRAPRDAYLHVDGGSWVVLSSRDGAIYKAIFYRDDKNSRIFYNNNRAYWATEVTNKNG